MREPVPDSTELPGPLHPHDPHRLHPTPPNRHPGTLDRVPRVITPWPGIAASGIGLTPGSAQGRSAGGGHARPEGLRESQLPSRGGSRTGRPVR